MATKAKTVKKKVKKKATTKKVTSPKVMVNKVSITLNQAKTLVKFYEKNNAKVPAFLAKLV